MHCDCNIEYVVVVIAYQIDVKQCVLVYNEYQVVLMKDKHVRKVVIIICCILNLYSADYSISRGMDRTEPESD